MNITKIDQPLKAELKMFDMTTENMQPEKITQDVNFSSSYISMPYSLSVKESLKVFARLYRVKDKGIRISELLKTFEIEDIKDVLVYNPEILIVGTGANGLMRILDETKRYLESKGIELRIADTEKACKIYNELQGKRKVIGAFHLTC